MAPPSSEKNNEGTEPRNPFKPSRNGEFVICSTSQPSARFCIHVPMLERKLPDQNKAKSRRRSERNMWSRRGTSAASAARAVLDRPAGIFTMRPSAPVPKAIILEFQEHTMQHTVP